EPMSITDARIRISSAHRDLLAAWWRVEGRWTDQNAAEFGRRVIGPIETSVRNAVGGIEKLESDLHAMKVDCEVRYR
ncbi:MAG: hypothetical protein ACKO3W_10315, partial [bacterium]